MNMLQMLAAEAARNAPHLATLRETLVKEIIHHEILLQMRNLGMLKNLVFIGGTCLRACYGAERLSEDLDFTARNSLDEDDFAPLISRMPELLQSRFGIPVSVSPPKSDKEGQDVITWKFSLEIAPQNRATPKQIIHVDICNMPSFEIQPMMLRNHYGVDLGTNGLIINTESLSEILADKILAFTLRPNRIKWRDVWDIIWLTNKGVELPVETLFRKVKIKTSTKAFQGALLARLKELKTDNAARAFQQEMTRFLPGSVVQETIMDPGFWNFAQFRIEEATSPVIRADME